MLPLLQSVTLLASQDAVITFTVYSRRCIEITLILSLVLLLGLTECVE